MKRSLLQKLLVFSTICTLFTPVIQCTQQEDQVLNLGQQLYTITATMAVAEPEKPIKELLVSLNNDPATQDLFTKAQEAGIPRHRIFVKAHEIAQTTEGQDTPCTKALVNAYYYDWHYWLDQAKPHAKTAVIIATSATTLLIIGLCARSYVKRGKALPPVPPAPQNPSAPVTPPTIAPQPSVVGTPALQPVDYQPVLVSPIAPSSTTPQKPLPADYNPGPAPSDTPPALPAGYGRDAVAQSQQQAPVVTTPHLDLYQQVIAQQPVTTVTPTQPTTPAGTTTTTRIGNVDLDNNDPNALLHTNIFSSPASVTPISDPKPAIAPVVTPETRTTDEIIRDLSSKSKSESKNDLLKQELALEQQAAAAQEETKAQLILAQQATDAAKQLEQKDAAPQTHGAPKTTAPAASVTRPLPEPQKQKTSQATTKPTSPTPKEQGEQRKAKKAAKLLRSGHLTPAATKQGSSAVHQPDLKQQEENAEKIHGALFTKIIAMTDNQAVQNALIKYQAELDQIENRYAELNRSATAWLTASQRFGQQNPVDVQANLQTSQHSHSTLENQYEDLHKSVAALVAKCTAETEQQDPTASIGTTAHVGPKPPKETQKQVLERIAAAAKAADDMRQGLKKQRSLVDSLLLSGTW